MILAHVAGLPIEETLASGGPALLTALGMLAAWLRARRRAVVRPPRRRSPP